MKWFYIITAALMVIMGLSPIYLIKPVDTSVMKGKVADPIPENAPSHYNPTFHDVTVIYDSYGEKIKSLDPATCGDTSSAGIQGNLYESLYAYHFLERPIEIIPQLAESMPEVSPDGLTYTIRIKKGVKYHHNECFGQNSNGEPRTREVKAQDFVLAFKRICDYHVTTELSYAFIEGKIAGVAEYRAKTQAYNKGDFSRYDNENIEGIKATDDYTLQIGLKASFPQLLYVLAINNYAPIPREVVDFYLSTEADKDGHRRPLTVEKRTPEIHDFRAAVGTGAYYLKNFVDGGEIVFCRNPDYRPEYYPSEGGPGDKEAGLLDDAGKRVPFVDVIYMGYVPESNPMWMLFMTRQSDIAGIPMEMYHQVITTTKELDDRMAKQGIRLLKYTSPAVYWLTFNMEDRVLGNSKSLRQAMCLAFNVEEFIKILRNDRGIRAVNIVPTGFEAHDEAGPGHYSHYSKEQAISKLQDAKKELIAAGIISPGEDIPPLTLDLGGADEDTRRYAEFTQQQFKAVGINLKIELQDWPTLLAKMNKKQCQIYSSGWHADYPDPENFLQLFYSPNIKRGTNNSNYSNPEFDELYKKAAVMQPSKERTEIYVKMITMLSEDCPMLLQSEPVAYVLIHPWVHNVKPHPIGYGFTKYRRIDANARRKAGGR